MYDDYGYDDSGYSGDSRDQYGPDYRDESRQYHRAPPPPESAPRGPPMPHDRRGPPPGQKKVSIKCIGGMIVAIVALILLFMFMSYPWYSISYHGEQEVTDLTNKEYDFKMEYYRDRIKVEYEGENQLIGQKLIIDENANYNDPAFNNSADGVKETMDNVGLIITITMILLIISIIVIPIAAMGKIPHAIGTIFLILALVCLLIIPIYMYFNIPPAVEQQIDDMPLMVILGRPINETFKYNGEFLGSGKGTDYQDLDIPPDDEEDEINYEMKWTPELGFWMIFVPVITILAAQIVYSSGKADLPGRGRPRDSHHRPPPPRRERGDRDRDRGRVRDHGPPRPMSEEDYDHIPTARRRPPPRDEYGYDSPPPPPPPRRRRREPSYDSPPPPPRRPPRQRRQDQYY